MRRTKIVATLGPATQEREHIEALIAAGVDVFRINFSHGSRATHQALCERVRAAERKARRPVAIMQDLAGPKIRTGALGGGKPVTLATGARVRLGPGESVGRQDRVAVTIPDLARSVSPGARVLLDDGRIELEVIETDGDEVVAEVTHGGVLGEHKGLNVPGVGLARSGLTEKDAQDLEFGLTLDVDMVAVSFVETAADIEHARSIVRRADRSVWLVAKIERPRAVEEIHGILDAADAIMVARGDLGLEIPLERVPRVQKELTRLARARGVPVIVATQVLDTMRVEPRPTRAEVSDAANAVDDGVDAIMLAGETAVGRFPVESVTTLGAIIVEAESTGTSRFLPDDRVQDEHGRALCEAAVTLADRSKAAAIVAVTHAGLTARQLAALRPAAPIYAATDREATARQLTLCWGVVPVETGPDTFDAPQLVMARVRLGAGLDKGVVVFVRIHSSLDHQGANFVSLGRLAKPAPGTRA